MNMGQKREEKKKEVVITNRNVVDDDSGIRITRYRKRKKKANNKNGFMDEKGCKSERDSTWSDEIVNEMAVARRNAFSSFLNFV